MRRRILAIGLAIGMCLAVAASAPASAHNISPPSGACGVSHGCMWKDADYKGTKVLSPSPTLCHKDFSKISGANDSISSVYNTSSTYILVLYRDKDYKGGAFAVLPGYYYPHLSTYGWNDIASSCRWVRL